MIRPPWPPKVLGLQACTTAPSLNAQFVLILHDDVFVEEIGSYSVTHIRGFTLLPRLVSNSCPQAIFLPQPSKVLGLQAQATVPGFGLLRWGLILSPRLEHNGGCSLAKEDTRLHLGLAGSAVWLTNLFLSAHIEGLFIIPSSGCAKIDLASPLLMDIWGLTLSSRLKCSGTVSADYRCAPLHPANFLLFFIQTGSHYIAQAALEHSGSSNLPAMASQSAGIAGVSYHAWSHNYLEISLAEHKSWTSISASTRKLLNLPKAISNQQHPGLFASHGDGAILSSQEQLNLQMPAAPADTTWSRRITQLSLVNSQNHEKQ
ncbi:Protein GVQW1 [Plecturocebus cupreus]